MIAITSFNLLLQELAEEPEDYQEQNLIQFNIVRDMDKR